MFNGCQFNLRIIFTLSGLYVPSHPPVERDFLPWANYCLLVRNCTKIIPKVTLAHVLHVFHPRIPLLPMSRKIVAVYAD